MVLYCNPSFLVHPLPAAKSHVGKLLPLGQAQAQAQDYHDLVSNVLKNN